MSVRRLQRIVAGLALGVGLPALAEQGSAAMVVGEPPRTSAIEPANDGLYADVLGRAMGSDRPAYSMQQIERMAPALAMERQEAITNLPARTDFLVLPDGKVHVRVRELWRLSKWFSRSKLIAVPAAPGASACVWVLNPYPGFLPHCPEFQPVWRPIEGLPDAESGGSLVLNVVDHARPDALAGSAVVTVPPLAKIAVARLSASVDLGKIKREVCSVNETKRLRLTLPWPEGVVDAWLAVTGPDGNQIMQGVASRGGTDREVWFWSDLRWADPSWSSIELPEGMDPESVRVEVWWIENTGPAAVKPDAGPRGEDTDHPR